MKVMYKDPEKRKLYLKEWKRQRSLAKGTLGQRGKHEHAKFTESEFEECEQKTKQRRNSWAKEYSKVNPKKRLLYAARKRAKQKGLQFNLIEDDIIIPENCPYLGLSFELNAPRGTDRSRVCSLDRIVPELGYVKGNVEVISHLANTMKQHATPEQLVLFAKAILERYE